MDLFWHLFLAGSRIVFDEVGQILEDISELLLEVKLFYHGYKISAQKTSFGQLVLPILIPNVHISCCTAAFHAVHSCLS